MRFRTAGEAKFAVCDCLVPFDDKSILKSVWESRYATIITPYHSTTQYVDAAYCYRSRSVVCRLVCRSVT